MANDALSDIFLKMFAQIHAIIHTIYYLSNMVMWELLMLNSSVIYEFL